MGGIGAEDEDTPEELVFVVKIQVITLTTVH